MNQVGHPPPQIHTESHRNVNLCPVFYLMVYFHNTKAFRKTLDGSQVFSLFLGNNR